MTTRLPIPRLLRSIAVLVALAVLVPTLAFGGGTEGKVSAKDVERRSKDMLEKVDWQPDMDTAFAAAKRDNKPVLWVQMVGDLDGGL